VSRDLFAEPADFVTAQTTRSIVRGGQEIVQAEQERRAEAVERWETLTDEEAAEFERCESVIHENLAGFVAVGMALWTINLKRLYRPTHRTFAHYVADRWELSTSRAYQLMTAAEVHKNVHNCGQTAPPTNEAQARPLGALLSPEAQTAAWELAVETAPKGKVTAQHVERVVEVIRKEAGHEQTKTEPIEIDLSRIPGADKTVSKIHSIQLNIRFNEARRQTANTLLTLDPAETALNDDAEMLSNSWVRCVREWLDAFEQARASGLRPIK